MMNENPLKVYGDITVVTGKYEKDGKEKNRYHKVGTLLATPHFSRIAIKLDSLPYQTNDKGEIWLNVFAKEENEQKSDNIDAQATNSQIKLSDIPF
jgi:hypothetical protein